MIQITKNSDLLRARPVSEMIREHGQDQVKGIIMKAIVKCAKQLQVECNPLFIDTLSEDLIESYPIDTVEDILEALKRGRRGEFGKVYNKLTMIEIREWISYVLDLKYREKERVLSEMKQLNEPLPMVDYEAYKARQKEPEKQPRKDESDYNNFKMKYLKQQSETKKEEK